MPMRISLALGPRRALSRQSAWGCLTTNLALPGSGSLTAGRISGYPQLALALIGFALTSCFAARFFAWYLVNKSRFSSDDGDPFARLAELWLQARWPLLGIAVFAAAWLWALATSFQILHEARRNEPPKLSPSA